MWYTSHITSMLDVPIIQSENDQIKMDSFEWCEDRIFKKRSCIANGLLVLLCERTNETSNHQLWRESMYLLRSTQLDHPFNGSSSVATEPLSKLCHNLIHALMCPELTEVGHASQKEGCEGGDQRIDILKFLNLMRRSRWKRLFSLVAWEPISKLA